MSHDLQHRAAQRQLLGIYCALLPEQQVPVRELLVSKVPLHTVLSLYPLDWQHLAAHASLPDDDPTGPLLELRRAYFDVEEDLGEVEGGLYGAAGTELNSELSSSIHDARIERILAQLPAYERDGFHRAIIEEGLRAAFWYTWSLQNWPKLGDGPHSAKVALISALDRVHGEVLNAVRSHLLQEAGA